MFSLPFVRSLLALGYSASDAQRMSDDCDYDERAEVLRLLTTCEENASEWT